MSAGGIFEASGVEPSRLHECFTRAFADYLIGPFEVPLARWQALLARQGVDLGVSRVAVEDGEPVAFCLVAPRPTRASWRLGTMGALPAARGTGVAQALLDDFIGRAAGEGLASVELECFAQNTRALRLYESRGFAAIDALHGWERTAQAPVPASVEPHAVVSEDAFRWLDDCEALGFALPLQVTSASLRALPTAPIAWRVRSAQIVFSAAGEGPVVVHSLVDRDAAQQAAGELVAALLASHPGRTIRVPQLQRTPVGGDALARNGFVRLPLHQVWMRKAL